MYASQSPLRGPLYHVGGVQQSKNNEMKSHVLVLQKSLDYFTDMQIGSMEGKRFEDGKTQIRP